MTQELAIAGIVISGLLALNCVYGLFVLFAQPQAAPASSHERWLYVFFGLQRTLMLLFKRYASRGLPQAITVWFVGAVAAIAYISGFPRLAPNAHILFWVGALALLSFPASVILWPLRTEGQ